MEHDHQVTCFLSHGVYC